MSIYKPRDRAEAKKSLIVLAIVIVAVCVVVAIAIGALTSGSASGVKMSSFTYVDVPAADATAEPGPGNKYVRLTTTITNTGSNDITLNPNYFKLETSDGQIHTYSWWVDYNMPQGLAPGASATITLGFEIPSGSAPETLRFQEW